MQVHNLPVGPEGAHVTTTQETWRTMLAENPVLPSPMCGISDYAFRSVTREHAAPLTYTQMVSAESACRNDSKALSLLDLHGPEPRLGIQLFGSDPERFGEAGAIVQELGACVVDINMGCPAKKVTAGRGGSALLREPDTCQKIFRLMRATVTVPLTVKMRWDWDDDAGASLNIAKIAEAEGLDGVCLHARTRTEAYSGTADWDRIRELKEAVSIPVIGNGDVRSPQDAVAMLAQTGCDGVMIGRGAIGNPWLMQGALAAAREYRELEETPGATSSERFPDTAPDWETRKRTMIDHARLMAEAKGERLGLVQFRKHASAYMRGVRGVKKMRPQLMQVSSVESLIEVLESLTPGMAEAEEEILNRADSA